MRGGDDRVDPGEKFVLEMDDGGDVSVTLSGTSHVIKFAISRGPVRGTASHIKIRVPVFLLLISRERLNLTFPEGKAKLDEEFKDIKILIDAFVYKPTFGLIYKLMCKISQK